LADVRVIVTRARDQASTLVRRLEQAGAVAIEVPVIEIAPPADGGAALRAAAAAVDSFDWIVLTSANGVDPLVAAAGRDALQHVPIAVVGPGTADRLAAHGLDARLVPMRFVAEGLLDAFPPAPGGGGRVLLAQAARARDVLAAGLRERGWMVDVVDAYRTVAPTVDAATRAAVASADAITFTSGSTVENFVAAFGPASVPAIVACIGPVTADTARARGLAVTVVAQPHTIAGLVDALVACIGAAR
jgi:uroporphyrinogen III methyltransferase/synthase